MDIHIQKLDRIEKRHFDLLLEADPSKRLVEDYLARSFCFEASKNKQFVGIIVLLPTRAKVLEIVNLAVKEDFRNQKVGQTLISFALTFARKNRYDVVEIGTGSTGFSQLYLYQKCGFRMTHIDSDFFIRHYQEPIFENNLQLKDMVRLSYVIQNLDD